MISPVPQSASNDAQKPIFRQLIEPTALLAILWRRKLVLVAMTVLGLVGGVVIGLISTARYESRGLMLVMQQTPTFVDSTGNLDARNFDSLFATHIRLIGSPRIVGMAMKRGNLDELPGIQAQLTQTIDAVEYIKRNLSVSRSGEGDSKGAFVINIGFRHPVPEESPLVVENVMAAYNEFLGTSALSGQGQIVSLIANIREQAANDVDLKNEAYRKFLMKAPGVWNRQTLENSHQRRIDELEAELTLSELKKVKIESRLGMINESQKPAMAGKYTDLERLALIDDLHVERLSLLVSVKGDVLTEFLQAQYPERQEHANARYNDMLTVIREHETLRSRLGPNHPKVKENERDIEALKKALSTTNKGPEATDAAIAPRELVRAYRVLLENDLMDTDRNIDYLTGAISREEKLAKNLLDVSLESEKLLQDYERSSEVYSALLEKFREQSLMNEFGEYNTEVLAKPKLGEKVWPRTKVLAALGLVLGMFLGILLAIGLDLRGQHAGFGESRVTASPQPSPIADRM